MPYNVLIVEDQEMPKQLFEILKFYRKLHFQAKQNVKELGLSIQVLF